MEAATLVALINGSAQIIKAAAPLIAAGRQVFSSEDEAQVRNALADLQASGDALHERVQHLLRGQTELFTPPAD